MCIARNDDRKQIVVWNTKTGELIGQTTKECPVRGKLAAVSGDGKEIVTELSFDCVRVWNIENSDSLAPPERLTNRMSCVAYCGHGTRMITGSREGYICVWDTESGEVIGNPQKGHSAFVIRLVASGDGSRVVSISADCTACLWGVNDAGPVCQLLSQIEVELPTPSIAINNDGTRLAFVTSEYGICVWDIENGELTQFYKSPHGFYERYEFPDYEYPAPVAISEDGMQVAFGLGIAVVVWDVERCRAVGPPLQGHDEIVLSVAFSSDGSV